MKRWPIIPTVIVAAAVITMGALGIWQLQRMGEKEALLTRLSAAQDKPAIAWPSPPVEGDLPLYRNSSVNCIKVTRWQAVSGKSVRGESGIAHLASCQTSGAEGPGALIALGWSNRLDQPKWQGGIVEGIIAPDRDHLIRLVATDNLAGLQRLSPPSTDSIPNNHLAYAIQWFFFAFAAAVIFVLAVRKRQAPVGTAHAQCRSG